MHSLKPRLATGELSLEINPSTIADALKAEEDSSLQGPEEAREELGNLTVQ